MKSYKILTVALALLLAPILANAQVDSNKNDSTLTVSQDLIERVKGKILLQVQDRGQAYYVDPTTEQRAYLGRPSDAFRIMSELGLGISNADLEKIASPGEAHKYLALAKTLAGRIVLQVEEHGEAYYISPIDFKKHYLGRPDDAFNVMRDQGLGITNKDLEEVPIFQKYKERVKNLEQNVKTLTKTIESQQQAIKDLQEQIQQNDSAATTTTPSLPKPTVATSTPSVLPATPAVPAIPAVPATPSPDNGTPAVPATPATPAVPATPTTPATPDTTAPVITNIQVISITETSAIITWTTNEASNSIVSYATTPTASTTTDILQSSNTTNHSVTLSGLAFGTTHYFTVSSADTSGNTVESNEQSFTTALTVGSDVLSILQATQFDVRASTTGPAGEDMWTVGMQYSMMIYTACPPAADVRVGLLYAKENTSSINGTNIDGVVGVISGHKCSETNQLNPDGTELFRLYNLPPNANFHYQVVFFKPEVSYWPPLALSTHPELTDLGLDARKIYTDDDKANEIYRVPVGSFTTPAQ